MKYLRISEHTAVQQAYERMRQSGQSHSMAEMLALRRVPACRTNATLLAAVTNEKEAYTFDDGGMHSKAVVKAANRMGVHPKQYRPQLADFAGDPKAFLPNDDPRGHLKRVEQSRKDRGARLADTENSDG